jgi:hypothetical protein
MTLLPTCPRMASGSPPSSTRCAGFARGLRPCLTAVARAACDVSGRDEETACFSRTKKHHRRHGKALLHNLTDTTNTPLECSPTSYATPEPVVRAGIRRTACRNGLQDTQKLVPNTHYTARSSIVRRRPFVGGSYRLVRMTLKAGFQSMMERYSQTIACRMLLIYMSERCRLPAGRSPIRFGPVSMAQRFN